MVSSQVSVPPARGGKLLNGRIISMYDPKDPASRWMATEDSTNEYFGKLES